MQNVSRKGAPRTSRSFRTMANLGRKVFGKRVIKKVLQS